ncbi:MAG: hypothetical protein HZB91_07520 [Elusimicrobia bacterium]|nr:hypothetical protein [Elusimicrobiota bacterium]
MRDGKWLQPRYAGREVFERDYATIDFSGLDVYCPGCRTPVKLSRKAAMGRIGGWCKRCDRGVCP